jgi:hypothetical protein
MLALHTTEGRRDNITPPASFTSAPLTPPPTDEKTFTQASRVIAHFKDIQAGRHTRHDPWTLFQLSEREYEVIEYRLKQDESLFGYVKDKIRCVTCREDKTFAYCEIE